MFMLHDDHAGTRAIASENAPRFSSSRSCRRQALKKTEETAGFGATAWATTLCAAAALARLAGQSTGLRESRKGAG
jgi:hypothetical protein